MESKYFNLSTSLLFLILALILFVKRSPGKKSNSFLGGLFVLIAFYTELVYLHFDFVQTSNTAYLSYYFPLDALLLMLMSPCLYFYVLSLLNRPVKLIHGNALLHLIPLLPCLIFNFMFSLRPVPDRVNWLIQDFYSGSMEMTFINAVLYLQIIVYLWLGYRKVMRSYTISPIIETDGYRVNITWVRFFLLTNLVIATVSLPICFKINNERTSIIIGQTAMQINLLFLFVLNALNIHKVGEEKIEEKKTVQQIDRELAEEYMETLINHMKVHKPHCDINCSVRTLSLQTDIPERLLSKALNTHSGISCSEFINQYRLKEAVLLLQNMQKSGKTIDAIVVECGFGSRSSFYRLFKEEYSVTPSEYRKQLARDSAE